MKLGPCLRRLPVRLLSFALMGCAQLAARPELPVVAAVPPGESAPFDRAIGPAESQHPGQSGFRLVGEGTEAFVTRVHSARLATRSLDVQTYIWHADLTGLLLAHALVDAADRGVRVRLLLDDMDARAKNAGLAALAAHPNIEVRLFNPFASRQGVLRLAGEFVSDFARVNRRMHNKSWVADNRLSVVGGRNIGDEYFSASKAVNFVDLDFSMVGPVVREVSASFDRYWNAPQAYPIELLASDLVGPAELETLRAQLDAHARQAGTSHYAVALRGADAARRLVAGDWPLEWSSTYRFVADDPLKVTMAEGDPRSSRVAAALLPWVEGAQSAVTVVSPYFVPGDRGTELLTTAARNGRQVRVLTNSLVANDVAAVHGGYSRYRKALLAGGVQLWELKPLSGTQAQASLFGSSGASLHTKSLAVDRRSLFVGSYNLDPRSTWLNCEQGVLVENAALAEQLDAGFARQVSGEHAWQVRLEGDELGWSDGSQSFDSDPRASLGRRFQAWLVRVLHLESLL
jgi:putative cardiolipin synthase